ncbi:uncharacterized protein LOC134290321 [Aedes albopictus]|uniref:Reverse transcriptase n=1 Tax=Aedes albopictus TaxID=7160 RepID=A0ABM1YJH9_AEDAL
MKLLYLSLGKELQSIVKAANLRPSLTDPQCYSIFVKNIETHLRSMTDTTAEHQAFLKMKQGKDESTVTFHARLIRGVKLCGYNADDESRFVRAQLLEGLRNKELAKAARTYGYDTNFIVQSATREEVYEEETAERTVDANILEIGRRSGVGRKRINTHQQFGNPATKQRRTNSDFMRNGPWRPERPRQAGNSTQQARDGQRSPRTQDRNTRCPRCNNLFHRNPQCPALTRTCDNCGKRGHFAVACRSERPNAVQQISKQADAESSGEENVSYEKQNIFALTLEDALVDCCIGSARPISFLIDSGADVNVIGGEDWVHLKQDYDSGFAQLQIIQQPNKSLHAYASAKPMPVKCTFKATVVVPGTEKPSVVAIFHVVSGGSRSLLGRSTAHDLNLLKVGKTVNSFESNDSDSVFPKMPGVQVKFSVDPTIPPSKNAYYNVPAAFREAARKRLEEKHGIIEKVTKAPGWISGMSAVAKGKSDFRLVVNMRAPNKAINREYFRLPLIDEMRVKLHGAKYFSKLGLSNAFHHLELCEESRDLTTFLTENGMYRFTRLMFGVNCAPEIFQREMNRLFAGMENVIVYIDDILIFAETLDELRQTVEKVLQILRENNLTLNRAKCEYDKSSLTFLGQLLDGDGFHVDEEKIKSLRNFREPASISELRSFLGLASYISTYKYAQNQREALSAVWGVQHFSYFLLGRHFTLRTDVQGVAFILNSSREESKRALTRADGWALRLSPYSYDVEYVRGMDNIADPSSRLYNGEDEPFNDDASPWEIGRLEANSVEILTEDEIITATSEDETLKPVLAALESGLWSDVDKTYHNVRDELSVQDGMIIKTGCAVIPTSLQDKALKVAHEVF